MPSKKRRDGLERALAQLDEATRDPGSPEARAAIEEALDGSSFLAARAAGSVRDERLEGWADALSAALDRFLAGGAALDPGCHAKLAITEALDATDAARREPLLAAARCTQREGVGPTSDTAAPVRARAVLALARGDYPDLPLLAGELLADPLPVVRRAALRALESHGDRMGAGLAHLTMRRGDEDPLVVSEAMSALITLAPDVGVPAVAALLHSPDATARELAIVALGESRRPDALDALLAAMADVVRGAERATYFTALALHRSEPALRALLPWLEGSRADAVKALEALAIRRFEPEVRERVEQAARAAGLDAELRAAFER